MCCYVKYSVNYDYRESMCLASTAMGSNWTKKKIDISTLPLPRFRD